MTTVSATFSGPFFDTSARDGLAAKFNHDASLAIAEKAADVIKSTLNASIRHPSAPDYGGRRVRTTTFSNGATVYDSNAVYGPWLEGTGSRNSPVTRFPGYWSFRRSTQQIQASASAWAYQAVEDYVNGLNGGVG